MRYGAALVGSVGIDGFSKNAVFSNCFSTGNISSNNLMACLGGPFGEITLANAGNSSMTVNSSYSACNISATSTDNQSWYTRYVGGLIRAGYLNFPAEMRHLQARQVILR